MQTEIANNIHTHIYRYNDLFESIIKNDFEKTLDNDS